MAIVQPALKMDSSKLRQNAMLVLGGIATPEALAVVGGYANDPDPGVRKTAFARFDPGRLEGIDADRSFDGR